MGGARDSLSGRLIMLIYGHLCELAWRGLRKRTNCYSLVPSWYRRMIIFTNKGWNCGLVFTMRTRCHVQGMRIKASFSLLHPSLLKYCRTHNVSVCLYIAYIACGSASLYIKTLYFFLTVLALSAAATVANIKIRYDAKTLHFAIFGTRVICVFYSI